MILPRRWTNLKRRLRRSRGASAHYMERHTRRSSSVVADASQKYFRELLEVCAHADKSARPEIKEARDALAKQKV